MMRLPANAVNQNRDHAMNGKLIAVVSIFFGLALLLAACATVTVDKTGLTTGDDYVQGVCNQCHTHERICNNLGKDLKFWTKTISFMQFMGAPLDDREKQLVAEHLASLKPGDPSICRTVYPPPKRGS